MSSSLHIAHVLSSFGVGGQERVALDLAAGQAKRGHRVVALSLAAPPDGPLAALFHDVGIETITIPKRKGIDLTLPPRVALALRRGRIDVVHTHNPLPLIYAAPAAKLVGAVAVHTKHGRNPGSRSYHWLRRAAARCADVFVAVSETTAAQALDQRDCLPERLTVVTNGIELGRFRPDPAVRAAARRELGIDASAWVVGTVGRVDDNKNQSLLIRAAAAILETDGHVVIVGDGPAMATVRASAAAARPDRVHLLGRRMDVHRLIPAFDVFALSSTTEGLPLVLPEAMACAVPVVSTAVGGIPGVIDDGRTGLLVPAGDEPALAAALAALANDRARTQAMGLAARTDALARYSAERMLEDYMRLYEEARAG